MWGRRVGDAVCSGIKPSPLAASEGTRMLELIAQLEDAYCIVHKAPDRDAAAPGALSGRQRSPLGGGAAQCRRSTSPADGVAEQLGAMYPSLSPPLGYVAVVPVTAGVTSACCEDDADANALLADSVPGEPAMIKDTIAELRQRVLQSLGPDDRLLVQPPCPAPQPLPAQHPQAGNTQFPEFSPPILVGAAASAAVTEGTVCFDLLGPVTVIANGDCADASSGVFHSPEGELLLQSPPCDSCNNQPLDSLRHPSVDSGSDLLELVKDGVRAATHALATASAAAAAAASSVLALDVETDPTSAPPGQLAPPSLDVEADPTSAPPGQQAPPGGTFAAATTCSATPGHARAHRRERVNSTGAPSLPFSSSTIISVGGKSSTGSSSLSPQQQQQQQQQQAACIVSAAADLVFPLVLMSARRAVRRPESRSLSGSGGNSGAPSPLARLQLQLLQPQNGAALSPLRETTAPPPLPAASFPIAPTVVSVAASARANAETFAQVMFSSTTTHSSALPEQQQHQQHLLQQVTATSAGVPVLFSSSIPTLERSGRNTVSMEPKPSLAAGIAEASNR